MAVTTRYTIGIDIGGTFTDVVLMASDGTVTINKAPTTPHDFSIGVIDAIREGGRDLGFDLPGLLAVTELVKHGSTGRPTR